MVENSNWKLKAFAAGSAPAWVRLIDLTLEGCGLASNVWKWKECHTKHHYKDLFEENSLRCKILIFWSKNDIWLIKIFNLIFFT